MFRRRFAWRGIAVLGVAALALSACADDGDGDGSGDVTDEEFESTFELGVILPQTGQLAFLGPPMFAGVNLAVEEINEAGGVWGNPVEVNPQDEADDQNESVAVASAETLIREDVNAVVGAAATGMTQNIIELLRDNAIIQVSPSNTGVVLTDHEARDYYFRTAPSDVLQGDILAQEALADGHQSMAILARQDAYGEGLADHIEQVYEGGGGEVLEKIIYDPATAEYSSEVSRIRDADPDAIVIVSFDEASQIFPALSEGGLPTSDKQWYLVDGNHDNWGEEFPEGTLEGAKSTAPTSGDDEFFARLDEIDPELGGNYLYGPEAYDAVMGIALGSVAANTDDPDEVRTAMIDISRSPGTQCTSFAECRDLLENGEEIDYQGASGPVNWNDVGDPTQATIGVYDYGEDNNFTLDRIEEGTLE